jgi:FMN phosphatase YigB (HAD superfamily)
MNRGDWDGIRLVVFDVDGTLYRQRPLQCWMARDMLLHCAAARDTAVLRVIFQYRRIREAFASHQVSQFDEALIDETARVTSTTPDAVRQIIVDWIERRPLQYLAGCRYQGVLELFAGLRRKGVTVGVFSDYPARAKIDAMGLVADYVVAAGDQGVGLLKPHPKGLEVLMASARVGPQETLMIGDRAERDGLAARRAGTRALLRSSKPSKEWCTFATYRDPVFAPFIAA